MEQVCSSFTRVMGSWRIHLDQESVEKVDAYLCINWDVSTRNKEWYNDSRKKRKTDFKPKHISFGNVYWSIVVGRQGPYIAVCVS